MRSTDLLRALLAPVSSLRLRPTRRLVSATVLAVGAIVGAAALGACGAPGPHCGASYVVDQGAWAAGDYGAPDWSAPDPSDPSYYPYTDPSGDTSGDPSSDGTYSDDSSGYDPSAGDPSSSDPGSSDPGSSDPGSSDPGSSDPGSSDPGGDDTSTASVKTPHAPQPSTTTRVRPNGASPATDANGCYRCAIACDVSGGTTPMMASGASDVSVSDACMRAQRAITAWSANTGTVLGSCTPAS